MFQIQTVEVQPQRNSFLALEPRQKLTQPQMQATNTTNAFLHTIHSKSIKSNNKKFELFYDSVSSFKITAQFTRLFATQNYVNRSTNV